MNENGVKDSVQIVPARFFAVRCINDAKYFPEDTTLETERLKRLRDRNVQFSQGWFPSSGNHFSNSRVLSVQTLRTISLGE